MNRMIPRNISKLQKHKINQTLQFKNPLILTKAGLANLMNQVQKFKQE